MKPNHDNAIRKQLEEIQNIAQDLPKGRYLQIVNRCARIVYEMNRKAIDDARYPEEVAAPAQTHDEVKETCEKRALDRERILAELESGRPFTTLDALGMGILRCGARVWELRKKGYIIKTTLVKAGRDRVAEYTLMGKVSMHEASA